MIGIAGEEDVLYHEATGDSYWDGGLRLLSECCQSCRPIVYTGPGFIKTVIYAIQKVKTQGWIIVSPRFLSAKTVEWEYFFYSVAGVVDPLLVV